MLKNWKSLTTQTFTDEIKKAKGLSVVFFWGDGCSSCKTAESDLHQIDDLFVEHAITRFSVDAKQDAELAADFGLASIPSFLFFKAGQPINKFNGYPGVGELRTAIISQLL